MSRGNRKSATAIADDAKPVDGDTKPIGGGGDDTSGVAENILGAGTVILDPDSAGSASAGTGSGPVGGDGATGEQPKRGPGRPRGSGSKAKSLPSDVSGIEKLLVSVHGMVAGFTGVQELALDNDPTNKVFFGETESRYLAQSIKDVADHYGAELFDKKTQDWFNLIMCLGTVYGSRYTAIRFRMSMERRNAPPPGPRGIKPVQAPQQQNPVNPQSNGAAPLDARTGNIPGIANVEFPPDHPLSPKGH